MYKQVLTFLQGLVLDLFTGVQGRHQSYREKVQQYAAEEYQARDILLYGIWRTGQLRNENLGNC